MNEKLLAKPRQVRYAIITMSRLGWFCFTLILFGWLIVASACETSRGDSLRPAPTLITVIPSTFAGDVVCGSFDGAWQQYVATLTDVTDPQKPVTLASSGLVNCAMPVSFSSVEPGHRYTAQIDAYDRSDLVPAGGISSGSSQMTDPKTGMQVQPRWTAACGAPSGDSGGIATLCIANNAMPVRDCAALEQKQTTNYDTSLYIDLAQIRGVLSCGTEPGQVDKVVVSPTNATFEQITASCDEQVRFDKLDSNTAYYFDIHAYETQATEFSWATRCVGSTKEGIALPVSCDPLTDRGALRFDMQKILARIDRSCSDDDIMSYRLTLFSPSTKNYTKACTFPIILSNLSAGPYELILEAYGANHEIRLKGKCSGKVTIGRLQDITCDFDENS